MVSRNTALALVAVAAVALVAVAAVGMTQGNGNGGGEPQASVAYNTAYCTADSFEKQNGYMAYPGDGNMFFIVAIKLAPHGGDFDLDDLVSSVSTLDGTHEWHLSLKTAQFWAEDPSLVKILEGTEITVPYIFEVPVMMVENLQINIDSTYKSGKIPMILDDSLDVVPFAPTKG